MTLPRPCLIRVSALPYPGQIRVYFGPMSIVVRQDRFSIGSGHVGEALGEPRAVHTSEMLLQDEFQVCPRPAYPQRTIGPRLNRRALV